MLDLIWAFLQVGLLSIGGGYAAIPIIRSLAVDTYGWLTGDEFGSLAAIAEMTPGPIAVNSASFVGMRLMGVGGAIVATLACIFPSLIILSIMYALYRKYNGAGLTRSLLESVRPVVTALIASAAISMLISAVGDQLSATNAAGIILFAIAFFTLRKTKLSPIPVMFGCGLLYTAFAALVGA